MLTINALSNISIEVRDGERIGLVGQNGAGKTTLLRVLAGVYPPTAGTVRVIGRVSPMFDISLGMSPDSTGIENIRVCGALWGLSRAEIAAGIDDIVEFTELGDYLKIPGQDLFGRHVAAAVVRDRDASSARNSSARRDYRRRRRQLHGKGKGAAGKNRQSSPDPGGFLAFGRHHPRPLRKGDLAGQGSIAAFGAVNDVLAAYKASV